MSELQADYDSQRGPGDETAMRRQALPVPGRQNVTARARDAFTTMLDQREAEGIRKYGTTLQTHNGRDAHRDLAEELIDAWQYAKQAEMERADLIATIGRILPILYRGTAWEMVNPETGAIDPDGVARVTQRECRWCSRRLDQHIDDCPVGVLAALVGVADGE